MVKNLPEMQEMQETQVRFLSQEDLGEKEMATHSSILAWEIPRTEEPGRLQSMGLQRVGHAEHSVPTLGLVINDFFCYLSYSAKVLDSENLQWNTSY